MSTQRFALVFQLMSCKCGCKSWIRGKSILRRAWTLEWLDAVVSARLFGWDRSDSLFSLDKTLKEVYDQLTEPDASATFEEGVPTASGRIPTKFLAIGLDIEEQQ